MDQKHNEKSAPQPTSITSSAELIGAVERPGLGYFWNGRPIRTPELVKEANRMRKRRGLDQVGPECWRVP